MTVFCLGSINADHAYRVTRLPGPGETVLASAVTRSLGGKGANQAVAAARAGGDLRLVGMIGPDGEWCLDALRELGVDPGWIGRCDHPTAHANICVDDDGENQITVFPGANLCQDMSRIESALQDGRADDWLMLQNETSHQVEAAHLARERGLSVAYVAAPFEAAALSAVAQLINLVILNEGEAHEMERCGIDLPHAAHLITKGRRGATLVQGDTTFEQAAFAVDAVDTTGAGDTFAGYFVAGVAQGSAPDAAMRHAAAAAALHVTRPGAAIAIPDLAEVHAFLNRL